MAPPFEHVLPKPFGAAERAVHDVHRQAVVLAEHPDRRATEIGPGGFTRVLEEPRVHDLEATAADEDRSPAAAVDGLAGRVAVLEREVLHRQSGSDPGSGSARSSTPAPGRRCSCRGCGVGRAPLNVTLLPPSITMSGPVLFTILAVAANVIVIGIRPAVEGDDAALRDRARRPLPTCSSLGCRCRSPEWDVTCRPPRPPAGPLPCRSGCRRPARRPR